MENASKALIIAGAILLAILLISLGILVINSTEAVQKQAEDSATTMAIRTFNSQFIHYEGEKKTAAQIRSVVNTAKAASASSDYNHVVEVVERIEETEEYRKILPEKLNNREEYNVEIAYGNDGYVNKVIVKAMGTSHAVINPEPDPSPEPDPTPEPDPIPEPEPTPDPDPEPTPEPEPDPTPTTCPGTGNTCYTNYCEGPTTSTKKCSTCSGKGTITEHCNGGTPVRCPSCGGAGGSFQRVTCPTTMPCPDKCIWNRVRGGICPCGGTYNYEEGHCPTCGISGSGYYCSNISCPHRYMAYSNHRQVTCNKCNGRGYIDGGWQSCYSCSGSGSTSNPCAHGHYSAHDISKTCGTCKGTGNITTTNATCPHGLKSAHRYCSHYTNTTLTSHEYCKHGKTSPHDI